MNDMENLPWTGLEQVVVGMTPEQEQLLQIVRERLDGEITREVYLSERDFANLIGVDQKTLKNDRAPSGAGRYPLGIRFGGSRHIHYARQDVVDWMAHQELRQRMRRVHRCR